MFASRLLVPVILTGRAWAEKEEYMVPQRTVTMYTLHLLRLVAVSVARVTVNFLSRPNWMPLQILYYRSKIFVRGD
jgi:hypothetical protein